MNSHIDREFSIKKIMANTIKTKYIVCGRYTSKASIQGSIILIFTVFIDNVLMYK